MKSNTFTIVFQHTFWLWKSNFSSFNNPWLGHSSSEFYLLPFSHKVKVSYLLRFFFLFFKMYWLWGVLENFSMFNLSLFQLLRFFLKKLISNKPRVFLFLLRDFEVIKDQSFKNRQDFHFYLLYRYR